MHGESGRRDTMRRSQRKVASEGGAGSAGRTPKSFVCEHDGCGKRFTRLEHLNRHALNHTDGNATCPRCRAHFKRPDLLSRHMDRHRERDEEAGGIGILNTRKRSWKQDDGTVVERRPVAQSSLPEQQQPLPAVPEHQQTTVPGGPISPPTSHQSSEVPASQQTSESYHDLVFDFDENLPEPTEVTGFTSTYETVPQQAVDNFWVSPLQPQGRIQQGAADIPYDDLFQPDTASSFNMPYTTATNYNWLFDLEGDMGMNNQNINPNDPATQQFSVHGLDVGINLSATNLQGRTPESSSGLSQPVRSPALLSDEDGFHGNGGVFIARPPNEVSTSAPVAPVSNIGPDLGQYKFPLPPSITSPLPFAELERPLSTLQKSVSLPCIDDCTREEVLNLVESLRPISPEDEPVTRNHKLLSSTALQGYLDLFFTRFNTAYPLIHQPTFVASEVEPLLLLAMLLLGATYSGKAAHQLAVCIHDFMRPGIFSHTAFSARPELWVLQTILLVECFGKSRAGQKQHDMSHLFHGLLINMIRRSDCQTVQPLGPDEADKSNDDLEVVWHRWALAEQKKRLALLCFLWDTQHAVLFCQSLCMSSFELRLPLPASQSLWEAPTALEWKSHEATYTREPQFLTALRSYLTASSPRPERIDCLSRVLILHGLMSIFWDMQRRDQTSLGVIPGQDSNGLGTWRDRIGRAYDVWKAEFDAQCMAIAIRHEEREQSGEDPSAKHARKEFTVFATSYNAVYHSAQVLLNANFLDLQIYAGARHILGRPVQRVDYLRSERIVRSWAASDANSTRYVSAAKAAWHAASLLREAAHNLDDFDAMGLFHVPWCLYLATLTCWAFHHARQPRLDQNEASEEIVWDAKAEMDALITGMAGSGNPWGVILGQGRMRTGGLVWVMANVLERVRWGIVHAGVMVLRGLVPGRLVSQYEVV